MKASPKVFSLEEANALLPSLETLLAELEEKQNSFRKLQDELFFEEILDESSPSTEMVREVEEALLDLEVEIQKIREMGCILRHPERGLVDFLAKHHDLWIYLWWRRGEKEVGFYHTLQGGFLERRPLTTE